MGLIWHRRGENMLREWYLQRTLPWPWPRNLFLWSIIYLWALCQSLWLKYDQMRLWTMILLLNQYLKVSYTQFACMSQVGTKGWKIAQDLLWPRTKHLIEDHSMSFTSVLELAIGGEPTKIRIRFWNGTER